MVYEYCIGFGWKRMRELEGFQLRHIAYFRGTERRLRRLRNAIAKKEQGPEVPKPCLHILMPLQGAMPNYE
jgi:hypothetical protein